MAKHVERAVSERCEQQPIPRRRFWSSLAVALARCPQARSRELVPMRRRRRFVLPLLYFTRDAQAQCEQSSVSLDFSSITNPAVAMEWADAAGTLCTPAALASRLPARCHPRRVVRRTAEHSKSVALSPADTGQTFIPFQATDTSGAAFPGGSLRWRSLGSTSDGQAVDLLVAPTATAAAYGDLVIVEYNSPTSNAASQAVFTTTGYACIGFGVRASVCTSGASLVATTARCADGTEASMRAAEFDFRLVASGTTTALSQVDVVFTTFYDVDGDTTDGQSIFEFVAVDGASSSITLPSTSLEAGTFAPSGLPFFRASQVMSQPVPLAIE